jgi:hypothetical protein
MYALAALAVRIDQWLRDLGSPVEQSQCVDISKNNNACMSVTANVTCMMAWPQHWHKAPVATRAASR